MPYAIAITPPEAELLRAAGAEGLTGCLYSYEPSDTLKIIDSLVADEDNAAAHNRLVGRLSTLYGQFLVSVRRMRESAHAPIVEQESEDQNQEPPVTEPEVKEQVTKPARKRG